MQRISITQSALISRK